MPEPEDKGEFLARWWESYHWDGAGAELRYYLPCPFCAAPDFISHLTGDSYVGAEASCAACGRTARVVELGTAAQGTQFQRVSGPELPEWMRDDLARLPRW